MPAIEVRYEVGDAVTVGPATDRIEAVVSAIQVGRGWILYRVAYWSGEFRREEWVEEFEIEPSTERAKK